jgi:hypothetical protein
VACGAPGIAIAAAGTIGDLTHGRHTHNPAFILAFVLLPPLIAVWTLKATLYVINGNAMLLAEAQRLHPETLYVGRARAIGLIYEHQWLRGRLALTPDAVTFKSEMPGTPEVTITIPWSDVDMLVFRSTFDHSARVSVRTRTGQTTSWTVAGDSKGAYRALKDIEAGVAARRPG